MELLLEHTPWVRRLARRMLIDENSVDDVVQETYLAALKSPPKTSRPVLPWLGTVARNFVRMGKRGEGRRVRREQSVAADVEQMALVDPVERMETQQIVAEAVQSLQEPYRTTVFLHFYREMSATEIAAAQGVPANTVRVRLSRALKLLEEKLDHRYDGRRSAWVRALLPLAGGAPLPPMAPTPPPEPASSGAASSSSASTTRWGAATGVATLAIVALLGWLALEAWVFDPGTTPGNPETAQRASAQPNPGHAPHSSASSTTPLPGAAVSDAAGPDDEATTHEASSVPARTPFHVPFRVLDAETGAPIAGAQIYARAFSLRSEHLARGRNALEVLMHPFATERIGVTDVRGVADLPAARATRERLRVAAAGYREYRERAWQRTHDACTVRLHRASEGAVQIRDDSGDAAAKVQVRAVGNQGHETVGVTDSSGRFQFSWQDTNYAIEVLGDVSSERVAYAAQRKLAELPLTEISLVPGTPLAGRVTDQDGRPVADAQVDWATRVWPGQPWTTRTSATGDFAGPSLPRTGETTITVRAAGFAPQTRVVSLPCTETLAFVLTPGVTLAGRVFDPIGSPVAAGQVLLIPAEETFRGRDLACVPLGEDGAFSIVDVAAGNYQLLVESPHWEDQLVPLGQVAVHDAATQPRWLAITLRPGASVSGTVRYPDGTPAAGVALQVGWICGDEVRGPRVQTDAAGRFTVTGLWHEAPLARPVNRDLRWTAVLGPEARDLRAALLLEVQRPHDLLTADRTAVRRFGIYGSRNTCEVTPGSHDVELVVDTPGLSARPRFALQDRDGAPIRTVTNLLVIPQESPATGTNLIFGESSANAAKLHDLAGFDGALVGVLSRRYATTFVPVRAPFGDEIPVVLEHRVASSVRVLATTQQPLPGVDLFAAPSIVDRPAAAIYLGRSDSDGVVPFDFLASGDYDIFAAAVTPTSQADSPGQHRPGISVVDTSDLTHVATVTLSHTAQSPRDPVTIFLSSSQPAPLASWVDGETERSRSP